MIQKKISLLVMALVLLVSGIFININANDSDDKDTVSLTVHKVWENLPEDFEVEGIEVVLLRNEEVIETIILDDSNNWAYIWNDLEAYDEVEELYEYRVEELNVGEDFEVSYQTSREAKEIEVVITNTYLEPEEPGASIDDMEEIVDLGDIETFSDDTEVTISVTYNFEYVILPRMEKPEYAKYELVRYTDNQYSPEIIEEIEFNAQNNWTYTFENLERFSEEGEVYSYDIERVKILYPFLEVMPLGLVPGDEPVSCPDPSEGCDFYRYRFAAPKIMKEGIGGGYFGFIRVLATWENVPQGKELPSIEFGVQVRNQELNSSSEWHWVEEIHDMGPFFMLDGSETVPWTVNWFHALSRIEEYRFVNMNTQELEDYEISIENDGIVKPRCFQGPWEPLQPDTRSMPYACFGSVEITLTYIGEDPVDPVSITATKNWANLPQGKEVSGVEVALLRNGEAIDTVVLDNSNNWTYIWDDLDPVDEENNPYEYSVEERNVAEDFEVSYETEIYCAVPQDNEEDCNDIKVEITNTYIDPEKPIDPKEPEKPVNPEKPQEPELPNTGISQSISHLSGLMMIASGLLIVLVNKKRKVENKI